MRRLLIWTILLASLVAFGSAFARDRPRPAAVLVFEAGLSGIGIEADETIKRIAALAKTNRATWVTLESYSEDYSSAEMNLAMGQLRLDGVERRLELAGVPTNRIRRVNYGAEHVDGDSSDPRRIEIRIWSPGY